MDSNVLYRKMVEEVQFLELMLDSENRNLTRPPPKRANSTPAAQLIIESDIDGDETILKSCPAPVTNHQSINETSREVDINPKFTGQKNIVSDSPAIPDLPSLLAPSAKCKVPPELKPCEKLNEVDSGAQEKGHRKGDDVQKPVAPPEENLIGEQQEKLVPPSKKQIVCEETPCLYQTPAKPVFAWGPDVSVEDSGDYLNRGNLQMHGSHLSKGPISLNIPTDNTSGEGSISELDGCIQGVRLLCMAGVPKNSKESLLNKILELSSCIDEKYAIIDVSGLIEDNKGDSRNFICIALTVLEMYAANLLKEEHQRPQNWRTIDLSNSKFKQKVGFLRGFENILKKLGYDERVTDENGVGVGLKFPETVKHPNMKMVEKVLTDLCIANYEIDRILRKSHPNLKILFETKQIPDDYNQSESSDSDDDIFEDALEFEEPVKSFKTDFSPETHRNQNMPDVLSGNKGDFVAPKSDRFYQSTGLMPQPNHQFQKPSCEAIYPNTSYKRPSQESHVDVPSDSLRLQHPVQELTHRIHGPLSMCDDPPASFDRNHPYRPPANSSSTAQKQERLKRPPEIGPSYMSLNASSLGELETGAYYNRQNSSFKQPNQRLYHNSSHLREQRQSLYHEQYNQGDNDRFSGYSKVNYISSEASPVHFAFPFQQNSHNFDVESSYQGGNFGIGHKQFVTEETNRTTAENARKFRPQIYSYYEETEDHNVNRMKPRIYEEEKASEIYPKMQEIYDYGNVAASSQLWQKQISTSNEDDVVMPGHFYNDRQSMAEASAGFRDDWYRGKTNQRYGDWAKNAGNQEPVRNTGPLSYELPKLYQRNDSTDYERTNQYVPRYEPQRGRLPKQDIPSPSPGYYGQQFSASSAPFVSSASDVSNRWTNRKSDSSGTMTNTGSETAGTKEDDHWSCKHCTFRNPIGTKVCQMCYRTSWESKATNEADFEIIQASYGTDAFACTTPERSRNDAPFPETPLAPTSLAPTSLAPTSLAPTQREPNFMLNDPVSGYTPSARHHEPSILLDSTFQEKPSDGPYSFETSVMSQRYQPDGRDYFRTPPSQGFQSNQFSSTQSLSSGKKTMSAHEQRKQRELAERVGKDKKNQEKLRTDAQKLVEVLRIADERGFDVSDVQVALCHTDETSGIVDWLETQWPCLQTKFMNEFENDFGDSIAIEEARETLIKNPVDHKKALEECKKKRDEKIKELQEQTKDNEHVTLDNIKEALIECRGEISEALENLQNKVLEQMRVLIWQDNQAEATKNLHEKLMNKEIEIDDRTKIVLAQYGMKSWGRAGLVVKLIDNYAEKRRDEKSFISDCVEAANSNEDYKRALRFMEHLCPLCEKDVAVINMFTYLHCSSNDCQICDECVAQHVTVNIENICRLVCPSCAKPDQLDEENSMVHFQHLSHKIAELVEKGWLAENIRKIFEEKLRDFSLQDDPNFRWCGHCPEYGFLWEDPNNIQMHCTKCQKSTCFLCREKWEDQHKGITCEAFKNWKIANDPENQITGLQSHLAANGITCPKCNQRYDLARGGCIHFTCRMCNFQFCGHCSGEFFAANTCPEHSGWGLHCHHPRNCFYYFRDLCVADLQKLLKTGKIEFNTEKPASQEEDKCMTVEQKEREDGGSKYDEHCGKDSPAGFAGLCEKHYKEYLVELINDNGLDPIEVMDEAAITIVLQRHNAAAPNRLKKEKAASYLERLKEFVREKIPLQNIGKKATQRIPPLEQLKQQQQQPQQQQQVAQQQH